MSSQQQQQQPLGAEGASPNPLSLLTAKLAEYGNNARHNVSDGLNQMTPQSWIRLVMIVGGYMLLRQYVIKHSTKVAVRKLEEQEAADKEAAKVSPNELRGLKAQVPDDEDADEGADGTGANWGSKARVRQRKFLREMLEAEEKKREEDDDDADIKEFLED
ncbi:hypothetical protein PT974_06749 [Cladobotryum mycophilum]|uniref:Uncharacterized protein n=1 Tax=Cladobotryum mycophilum TaxID=491253 RepID=A0ABR0SNI4_9HYPO